jgi:hypothetical protein
MKTLNEFSPEWEVLQTVLEAFTFIEETRPLEVLYDAEHDTVISVDDVRKIIQQMKEASL